MNCAIKLSNSRSGSSHLTTESILLILENDDRKYKRAQDVIKFYKRQQKLLSAFDDQKYIS